MSITAISSNITPIVKSISTDVKSAATAKSATGGSFGQIVNDAVQQLNSLQMQANDAAVGVATGTGTDLHSAMISMEEASLSLQLALQVRNKMVDSYQEIMRMQV